MSAPAKCARERPIPRRTDGTPAARARRSLRRDGAEQHVLAEVRDLAPHYVVFEHRRGHVTRAARTARDTAPHAAAHVAALARVPTPRGRGKKGGEVGGTGEERQGG